MGWSRFASVIKLVKLRAVTRYPPAKHGTAQHHVKAPLTPPPCLFVQADEELQREEQAKKKAKKKSSKKKSKKKKAKQKQQSSSAPSKDEL
jgi:hypothetical protein